MPGTSASYKYFYESHYEYEMLAARTRMVAEEHHEFFSGETNPNDVFQKGLAIHSMSSQLKKRVQTYCLYGHY
jgi:hypothetical protein